MKAFSFTRLVSPGFASENRLIWELIVVYFIPVSKWSNYARQARSMALSEKTHPRGGWRVAILWNDRKRTHSTILVRRRSSPMDGSTFVKLRFHSILESVRLSVYEFKILLYDKCYANRSSSLSLIIKH